jgi:cellulose synthase/poly-beta-1,6-N-acetylglucosamine synthase-like glycosyltransferase
MKVIFWISLFIIVYTYAGYGLALFLLVKLKRILKGPSRALDDTFTPSLTLVVAAYNEEDIIEEKIQNTLSLNYPADLFQIVFVTDGSTDNTTSIISRYPRIKLLHQDGRSGKIAAVHRVMGQVDTEIVVFTDANTFLNKEALTRIARHYSDPTVGAVSGEKRVKIENSSDATAGEGFYWKYESKLKQWDAELYSVVGAAGELFSVKTGLYVPAEPDTLLDDFMISMRIAQKGYRIVYEPGAYATETASENITEELKRKIRIAAGGIQSIIRTRGIFNPFINPVLTFEYVSHRVLRWTITPFLLILVFGLNIYLVTQLTEFVYLLLLVMQVIFYGLAFLGWLLERKQMRIKILFIPYYFCLMNYAVIAGIRRYFSGGQSVLWEKAKRK